MLTPQQSKYVDYLVKGLSQRKAYKRAYDVKGRTDKYIDDKASSLFRNPEVRARYNELLEKASNRAVVKREEIIEELKSIAFANSTDFAQIKGNEVYFNDTDDIDKDKVKAISSIQRGKHGIVLRTHDKLKALEMLMQYVDIKGNDNNNQAKIEIEVIDNSSLKKIMKEDEENE